MSAWPTQGAQTGCSSPARCILCDLSHLPGVQVSRLCTGSTGRTNDDVESLLLLRLSSGQTFLRSLRSAIYSKTVYISGGKRGEELNLVRIKLLAKSLNFEHHVLYPISRNLLHFRKPSLIHKICKVYVSQNLYIYGILLGIRAKT